MLQADRLEAWHLRLNKIYLEIFQQSQHTHWWPNVWWRGRHKVCFIWMRKYQQTILTGMTSCCWTSALWWNMFMLDPGHGFSRLTHKELKYSAWVGQHYSSPSGQGLDSYIKVKVTLTHWEEANLCISHRDGICGPQETTSVLTSATHKNHKNHTLRNSILRRKKTCTEITTNHVSKAFQGSILHSPSFSRNIVLSAHANGVFTWTCSTMKVAPRGPEASQPAG